MFAEATWRPAGCSAPTGRHSSKGGNSAICDPSGQVGVLVAPENDAVLDRQDEVEGPSTLVQFGDQARRLRPQGPEGLVFVHLQNAYGG